MLMSMPRQRIAEERLGAGATTPHNARVREGMNQLAELERQRRDRAVAHTGAVYEKASSARGRH